MESKEVTSKVEHGSVESVVWRNGKCEDRNRCIRRDLLNMDTSLVLSAIFEKRDNVFGGIDGKITNGNIGHSCLCISVICI